jgi:hypothetical protein
MHSLKALTKKLSSATSSRSQHKDKAPAKSNGIGKWHDRVDDIRPAGKKSVTSDTVQGQLSTSRSACSEDFKDFVGSDDVVAFESTLRPMSSFLRPSWSSENRSNSSLGLQF